MFDGMLKDFGWSLVGSIFSNNIIHNAVGGNVLNLLLEAYIALYCYALPVTPITRISHNIFLSLLSL